MCPRSLRRVTVTITTYLGVREEARPCLNYCWTQAGCDIHHLDSDGDGAACQPTPVPGAEYVLHREF
jgi:hypothetical protein